MFAPRDKSQKMHLSNRNLPRVNLCRRFFHFFSSAKEIFSNFNASLFCRAPHHENSLNHWWDCLPWTRRGAIYAFQSRWSWMSPNNKVQFALEKLKWKQERGFSGVAKWRFENDISHTKDSHRVALNIQNVFDEFRAILGKCSFWWDEIRGKKAAFREQFCQMVFIHFSNVLPFVFITLCIPGSLSTFEVLFSGLWKVDESAINVNSNNNMMMRLPAGSVLDL